MILYSAWIFRLEFPIGHQQPDSSRHALSPRTLRKLIVKEEYFHRGREGKQS